MTCLFVGLSTWLHVLAAIVMISYFIFTGLIFLPVLERQLRADTVRCILLPTSAAQVS